ncbi:MAG TPA: hypothetical protein VKO42_02500 [Patescibacteria group bacterium]|nr:hypothetical protein [Patescibacteria group bacterium]
MIIDKIKKAINLVRKTGDKIVLFEEGDNDGVVVMSIEEYEKLAGGQTGSYADQITSGQEEEEIGNLTEQELIDKINRNVAAWQSQNQDQLDECKMIESFLGDDLEELDEEEAEEESEETEDNLYYYSEENFFHPFSSREDSQEEQEESGSQEESESKEGIDSGQKDRKSGGSNWEIPVNIKKNAEEVEE